MSRETFSIEHIVPWLDSDDPKGLFFDLNNIAFSHLSCNVGAARKKQTICGTEHSYNKGCRCEDCKAARSIRSKREYDPEKRKRIYRERGY